jgi:hypothetical protein
VRNAVVVEATDSNKNYDRRKKIKEVLEITKLHIKQGCNCFNKEQQ